MQTLRLFTANPPDVPMSAAWYLAELGEAKGVVEAIRRQAGDFTVADLQRECPGVSLDMIRHVLKRLSREGEVECLSRGRTARWRRHPPEIR